MPKGIYERKWNPIANIAPKPKRPWQDRFWDKVNKTETCWLWTAAKDGRGYGKLQVGTLAEPKLMNAARLSYEIANGPIAGRAQVLHHCDVRLCVRPDHLFLGTPADNMADKVLKGRQPRGESIPSSKLTERDVLRIRALYAEGISQSKLARAFGVNVTTIFHIVHNKTWKM